MAERVIIEPPPPPQRGLADRTIDASRFILQRGRINPILEREDRQILKQQKAAEAASNDMESARKKLTVLDGLLDTVRKTGTPDEIEAFDAQILPIKEMLLSQIGIPVKPPPTRKEEEKPETDLGKTFALRDRLLEQRAALEAEGAAPEQLSAIDSNIKAVDGRIDKISSREENRQVVEVNGRKVLIDTDTGETIRDLGASIGSSGKKPDYKTVRMPSPDGGVEFAQFNVNDPDAARAMDAALQGGGTLVTTPSANTTITTYDEQGRPTTVSGSGDVVNQRRAAQETNKIRTALDLGRRLEQFLSNPTASGAVGMQGFLKQDIFNKFMAQFSDGVFDPDASQGRFLLTAFRERAKSLVQDEQRLSDQDRAFLMPMFADNGIFESRMNALVLTKNANALLEQLDAAKSSMGNLTPITEIPPEDLYQIVKSQKTMEGVTPSLALFTLQARYADFLRGKNR